MRDIFAGQVTALVKRLAQEANTAIGPDVIAALQAARDEEESPLGRQVVGEILENAELAREKGVPLCQDTGMAVVFVRLGQEIRIAGGGLGEAIQDGIRQAYTEGFFRKSIVRDPLFDRINTGDNTPAVIHYEVVPGDQLEITVAPKGFGSENMSGLKMLLPADGDRGVKQFVLETVERAGANPCPPIVVGVGVGGTMEKAAILAKQALLRPLDQRHPCREIAALETELRDRINRLGIGPQGFGGTVTALAVNIEVYPTHIAGLPVAVNISCHAHRHATGRL